MGQITKSSLLSKSLSSTQRLVLYEYEQTLLDDEKKFDQAFASNIKPNSEDKQNSKAASDEQKRKNLNSVLFLWRFVIEEMLHWSPKEAERYLDYSTIRQLKLHTTIKKIDTPKGIGEMAAPQYILSLCYPSEITFDIKELAINNYTRVLKSNNGRFSQFPKNFFEDELGLKRTRYCLNYIISQRLPDYSIYDLFDLFANEKAAKQFLTEVKLIKAKEIYCTTCLEFFQTFSDKNSEFLYNAKRINRLLKYTHTDYFKQSKDESREILYTMKPIEELENINKAINNTLEYYPNDYFFE